VSRHREQRVNWINNVIAAGGGGMGRASLDRSRGMPLRDVKTSSGLQTSIAGTLFRFPSDCHAIATSNKHRRKGAHTHTHTHTHAHARARTHAHADWRILVERTQLRAAKGVVRGRKGGWEPCRSDEQRGPTGRDQRSKSARESRFSGSLRKLPSARRKKERERMRFGSR